MAKSLNGLALDLPTGDYWALTAYGDYLETITPGVRERAAQFGAPGFADVVGRGHRDRRR